MITGKVAITGASGQVGRALLSRLAVHPVHTVALVRAPVTLRASEVIAGPFDSPQASAALKDADLVVHLAGTLWPVGDNSYEEAILRTSEAVADAAGSGKARRLVILSAVGADEESNNVYLRYRAAAERTLTATRKDAVILRTTYLCGTPAHPGSQASALMTEGRPADVVGDGRQSVAPVYVGDVAAALESAMTRGQYGTYELAGPDRMCMDEFVRLLNQTQDLPLRHRCGFAARLVAMALHGFPGPMIDLLHRDYVGNPSRAVQTFGLALTSLRSVWPGLLQAH
jgi:NADH dehydrogenase